MIVYTSITKSYIPKARVLACSVKYFHPDWTFVLLLSDDLPAGFNIDDEMFDQVLLISELDIPNLESWMFGHAIVELCTAVKGPAAHFLAQNNPNKKIMYLDPDIKVFNSLQPLETLLDEHSILLTPHLLDLENEDLAIRDNEISALKHGVFNLGFFAARTDGQGLEFIKWWSARLLKYCRDDIPGGLFTDQRWCDLAPCFFDKLHVVRDKGYNVATWNIAHRHISKNGKDIFLADDKPLRFYHFTGFDSGAGLGMLERYASDQSTAHELWDTYQDELIKAGQNDGNLNTWFYGQYSSGDTIPIEARQLYRDREDLKDYFPNPYSSTPPSFQDWWKDDQSQNTSNNEERLNGCDNVDDRQGKTTTNPVFSSALNKIKACFKK